MKRGIRCILPVDFGIDLDAVEKIEFTFTQQNKHKEFVYPSETAVRAEEGNIIHLIWSQADTYYFRPAKVAMDTRITLTGTDEQPETPIISFDMKPTLFIEEVVSDDSSEDPAD